MSTITLGYDNGSAARSALDWAARRAARDGAQLQITTVTNMITGDTRRVARVLDDAARRAHDIAPGVHIDVRQVDGSMPAALAESARSSDLLVIGLHRGRSVRAALTGWMPLRLASRAYGPVALIPEDWSANDQPVTVGVDDDPSSHAAIAAAGHEAVAAGTRLRVLHAWSMPLPTREGTVALLSSPLQVKEQHRRILKDAVLQVRAAHPDLEIEDLLLSSNPTAALAHHAALSSILVLGTHRRGVLAGGFLGSVAQDLVGTLDCPLIVVPNPR